MKCEVCGNNLRVQWTDTHGVGACINCGLPYTILHYDGNKRIEKEPECAVKDEWIPVGKRYWEETKNRTFPAAYDMGILGSRGRSYSGATEADMAKWNSWLKSHADELPTTD